MLDPSMPLLEERGDGIFRFPSGRLSLFSLLGFLLACGLFAFAWFASEPDERPAFFLWATSGFAALFLLMAFLYVFSKKYLIVDGANSEVVFVKQNLVSKAEKRIPFKKLTGVLLHLMKWTDEGKEGVSGIVYIEWEGRKLCLGFATEEKARTIAKRLEELTGKPLREVKT